jgi:hypothetical protein
MFLASNSITIPQKVEEAENNKYSKFYDSTKTLYELKFGQEQPQDIWPSNKERFSDADFQRVNRKRNWVIPKPYLRKSLIGSLFTVFLSIIALSFVSMTLTDEEQKWIWISLAIIVLIIVICIIISRNKGGSSGLLRPDVPFSAHLVVAIAVAHRVAVDVEEINLVHYRVFKRKRL